MEVRMIGYSYYLIFPKLDRICIPRSPTLPQTPDSFREGRYLYKLYWERPDSTFRTRFGKDIKILPDPYLNFCDNFYFLIKPNYMQEIRRNAKKALEEWDYGQINPAIIDKNIKIVTSYVDTAFRTLTDCLYDKDTQTFNRSSIKTIATEIMLSRFWVGQTTIKNSQKFSGIDEMSLYQTNDDMKTLVKAIIEHFKSLTDIEIKGSEPKSFPISSERLNKAKEQEVKKSLPEDIQIKDHGGYTEIRQTSLSSVQPSVQVAEIHGQKNIAQKPEVTGTKDEATVIKKLRGMRIETRVDAFKKIKSESKKPTNTEKAEENKRERLMGVLDKSITELIKENKASYIDEPPEPKEHLDMEYLKDPNNIPSTEQMVYDSQIGDSLAKEDEIMKLSEQLFDPPENLESNF
jgi:hypothetical protein